MTLSQIKKMSDKELDRGIGFGKWLYGKMEEESIACDLNKLKVEYETRQQRR